jgi:hypothetical protein
MATRTNPLVSAAVLASAAAIAVATPAIAPSVQLPSPHLLEAAKVQLATFSDLLSIPSPVWTNTYFGQPGYGEAIGPNQDPDFDPGYLYVSTPCNYNCQVSGLSGLSYLALDALINGNGTGYDNVLKDPSKPYNDNPTLPNGNPNPAYNPYVKGYYTWNVSAVNYEYESNFGSFVQYVISKPFFTKTSPLYNPAVAAAIAKVFAGSQNVTDIYNTALYTLSLAALQVPVVGPVIYGSLQSVLGYSGYTPGLSGLLEYNIKFVTNGFKNPIPVPVTGSGASVATLAAASAPAASVALPAAETVADSPKVDAAPAAGAAKDSADTKVESTVDAPAVSEVKVSAPSDSKPAVSVVKDSTPAPVETPSASTPAPEVKVPEVKAPEVKVPDAPSVPDVKPSTPDAPTSQELKNLDKEAAKAEAASSSSSASSSAAGDNKAPASDAKASTSAASESTAAASDAKAGASDTGASKDAGDSAK